MSVFVARELASVELGHVRQFIDGISLPSKIWRSWLQRIL